jgi:hypothetical protein
VAPVADLGGDAMSLGVGQSGTGAGGFEDLTKSDVFDLLRNERRRYLLHYLLTRESPVELGELAERIAAWEYDTTVERVTSDQRKCVYTTLQQSHLPKMDAAEIVDYDADRGTIHRTEHTDKLNVYLEIVPTDEFPWREYYLALGAVFSAVAAALWVDVAPLTAVPDAAWIAVMAVVLTVSSAINVYNERSMRLGADELPPGLE